MVVVVVEVVVINVCVPDEGGVSVVGVVVDEVFAVEEEDVVGMPS